MSVWKLRTRFQGSSTILLENGARTTLTELRNILEDIILIDGTSLEKKHHQVAARCASSIPPKVILGVPFNAESECATSVEEAGLRDQDTLIIDCRTKDGLSPNVKQKARSTDANKRGDPSGKRKRLAKKSPKKLIIRPEVNGKKKRKSSFRGAGPGHVLGESTSLSSVPSSPSEIAPSASLQCLLSGSPPSNFQQSHGETHNAQKIQVIYDQFRNEDRERLKKIEDAHHHVSVGVMNTIIAHIKREHDSFDKVNGDITIDHDKDKTLLDTAVVQALQDEVDRGDLSPEVLRIMLEGPLDSTALKLKVQNWLEDGVICRARGEQLLSQLDKGEIDAADLAAHGDRWQDVYVEMVTSLLYAFALCPERATNYDGSWVRKTLEQKEHDGEDWGMYASNIDVSDEIIFPDDEIYDIWDYASRQYEKYEKCICVEKLKGEPEQQTQFDIDWLRASLGYSSPSPSSKSSDETERELYQVFFTLWKDAKIFLVNASLETKTTLCPESVTELENKIRPLGSCALGFNLEDSKNKILLSKDPVKTAESLVGEGIINAISAEGDNKIKRTMKMELRKRESETQAQGVYAAVLAGNTTVQVCQSSNPSDLEMHHIYAQYMIKRQQHEDVVQFFPLQLLKLLLIELAHDPDLEVRSRLAPIYMPLYSKRVFWNVIHHGKIGPSKTFEEGLASIVPEINFRAIMSRIKKHKYSSLEWAMD
eukprot:UC4_evm2s665